MLWYVLSYLWDDAYKEILLLIEKSSPYGGSVFLLSLSEWSFTICLTPYNRKQNVLSVSLNKTLLLQLDLCMSMHSEIQSERWNWEWSAGCYCFCFLFMLHGFKVSVQAVKANISHGH